MIKKFSDFVGSKNTSDIPIDLDAYSYASSEKELKPFLILWPESVDQVRRIMLYANQSRTPINIRGSGTSLVDGTVGENSIILSSERMNKILKIDVSNKIVEVEAGVRIADLNKGLAAFKMTFPLAPFNLVSTIGGMIALNLATKESHSLGRIEKWVEEIEFVDGTGKHFYTQKKDVVVGKEGLSGFITKAKLRIIEQQILSFDIFNSEQLSELLKKVRQQESERDAYFLEFFDKKLSESLGFPNNYSLIVAYTSLKGKNRTLPESLVILKKVESVHSYARNKGYYYLQDASLSLEKSYDLIEWCEKNNVALRGHIGIGLFYAYFLKEDEGLVFNFRSFVKSLGGQCGKLLGYGMKNASFIGPEEKKLFVKLKDEYDYNNIINAGKIINYR